MTMLAEISILKYQTTCTIMLGESATAAHKILPIYIYT